MEILSDIISDLKQGKSSDQVLSEIVDMIKLLLKKNPSISTKEFHKLLKTIGSAVRKECPNAFPVFNFLTRIISTNKRCESPREVDERASDHKKLFRVLSENIRLRQLEQESESASNVFEILNELNDFEAINEEIVGIAKSHIQSNELVLFFGGSDLLRDFIESSLEERDFSLIIVTSAFGESPRLADPSKRVTYLTEHSVGSVINKVSKIFTDCHSIMADGSLIGTAGIGNIAVLAKEFAIPLIALVPLHKFTPFYPFSQDSFNEFLKPQLFFHRAYSAKNIEVQVLRYDLVQSEYVTVMITQYGEYSNSYVYRAFSEYYGEMEYGYEF